ncbi:hypothetical protein ABPG72_001037 [Tetrahymena utriculariae]
MFHQYFNNQFEQSSRVNQFNPHTPFYPHIQNYNNNINYNNQIIHYNATHHQQTPYLVCQNNTQYFYPYQNNMMQFQQNQQQNINKQSFICYPQTEISNKEFTNQLKKSNYLSDLQEFSMGIQQSSYTEDQNQQISFLYFEKSRSGSQSECSWKSKRSTNANNIQIIQTIGKRIIEIQEIREKKQHFFKEEQNDEYSQLSLNPKINIQYPINYKEENICQFQQQIETNSQFDNEKESILESMNKDEIITQQYEQTEIAGTFESQQAKKQSEKLFFNNLQRELLKLYNLEDEKQLVIKIQEDLSQQCDLINNKQFEQSMEIQSKSTKKTFEKQHQTYLKCVYLNLKSEINKSFYSYLQEINLDNTHKMAQKNLKMAKPKFDLNQYNQKESYLKKQKLIKQIKSPKHLNDSQLNFQLKYCIQASLFESIKPKSISFLKNFDFSEIRQNYQKKKEKIREKKQNSSYVKNSQFHNLNKLFMYNILSMFRSDSLNNLNLPQVIMQELNKIILQLKISSRRDYKNPTRGFFDYFSHSHYKVLFLKINQYNIQQIRLNEQDIDLHLKCYKIDLRQEIPEIELAYMNLIKEINFRIFSINIQESQLFDDGTSTKQNIRKKYALKVIEGIKKLVQGFVTKRF